VKISLEGNTFDGMLNIGNRPTIEGESNETIEVNIFNFDEDIYNKELHIEFYERIRDETKFEDISLLKKQLEIDKEKVIQIFA
jgi:riboflavin kinase/FMN adenylyltransferase